VATALLKETVSSIPRMAMAKAGLIRWGINEKMSGGMGAPMNFGKIGSTRPISPTVKTACRPRSNHAAAVPKMINAINPPGQRGKKRARVIKKTKVSVPTPAVHGLISSNLIKRFCTMAKKSEPADRSKPSMLFN